jgi:DNA replication and repair protein RecF
MIDVIQIKHIRNIEDLQLEFKHPITYIYGDNGSGKTSILEAIYFVSTTKSHRTSDEKEMITHQQPFLRVTLKQQKQNFDVIMTKEGKRAFLNGVEKRKLSDFIGKIKVVMFAPEDIDLIKGAPSYRRQFLDISMSQMDQSYMIALNQYKKILKQRNALLKKIKLDDDKTFLNIVSEQLYEVGQTIVEARTRFIEMLHQQFLLEYQALNSDATQLIYEPDLSLEKWHQYLIKHQHQDILAQTTLTGPHRDDFTILFKEIDAKQNASQGQQRLLVVALKIALMKVIQITTKQDVILLLDDVLSELDETKQNELMHALKGASQIIINSAIPIQHTHAEIIQLKEGKQI